MKKFLFIFTFLLTFNHVLFAQSINTTHMFSGVPIKYLSKGNQKLGWVSESGNYYAFNLMDSLQNIVTITDSLLTRAAFGFPATGGGVTLCGSILNQNDNLIGMFYDWNCWMDTSMVQFPYFGNGCYFLYDFNTQQRNYFYFNTNTFVEPQEPNVDCDYHLNWKNDTLIITLQYYDQSGMSGGISWGNCLKFVNNQLVEQGPLMVMNYVVDVFVDPNGKINQLYDNNSGGAWLQNDGVNYSVDLTPSNTTYYADAYVKGSNLFMLQNHFSFIGEQDSIINYNGTAQSALISPLTGVYSKKAICVDHANRIWVANNDSVYMYNGSAWTAFGFGGVNLQSLLINPSMMKSFIEYKNNCFALSYAEDLLPTGGNGMMLFCYDSTTVTSIQRESNNQIKVFPNPANDLVTLSNLKANDKVVLYNIIGEVQTIQNALNNSTTIDLSSFTSGIYFIEVFSTNKTNFYQKIVITRK